MSLALRTRAGSRPRNRSNLCSSRTCKSQNTHINTQFNSTPGISPAANIYGFAAVHTRSHIPRSPAAAAARGSLSQLPLLALHTLLWEQHPFGGACGIPNFSCGLLEGLAVGSLCHVPSCRMSSSWVQCFCLGFAGAAAGARCLLEVTPPARCPCADLALCPLARWGSGQEGRDVQPWK